MSGSIGKRTKKTPTRNETVMKLISRALHRREDYELGVLDYLQRLNLAGLDVKGQTSSAYAQSGIGLSVGASVDFGPLLLPCLTLSAKLDVDGEPRTAHGLLVLQRLPGRAWGKDIVQPPQPANLRAPRPPLLPEDWRTGTPIGLAFLKGRSWTLNASAALTAALGVGSVGNFDEIGLSIGATAEVAASTVGTELLDPQPRHYRHGDNAELKEDLIDLFEADLKNKAASWLLEMGGRMQDLTALGQPPTLPEERVSPVERARKGFEKFKTWLDAYDQVVSWNDISAVTAADPSFHVLTGLADIATNVGKAARSHSLETAELLKDLATAKGIIDAWLTLLKTTPFDFVYDPGEREALMGNAQRRIDEADLLMTRLKKRQDRKANPIAAAVSTGRPIVYLSLASTDLTFDVKAAVKAVFLPKENKAAFGAAVGSRGISRLIAFSYQTYVPGTNSQKLTCSQETVIEHKSIKVDVDKRFSKWIDKSDSSEKVLNTLAYQSVMVNWFQGSSSALPNGSGVSFGMSILAANLANYVRACKGKPGEGPPADIPDELRDIETNMLKQLRVTKEELRRFARHAPSGLGDAVLRLPNGNEEPVRLDSYLLESAFAIKQPIDLAGRIDAGRATKLRALNDFATLLAIKDEVLRADQLGANLRLQVIRLRIRINSDQDMSANVLPLGWTVYRSDVDYSTAMNPTLDSKADVLADPTKSPFAAFAGTAVQMTNLGFSFKIGVERVRRAGTEGIITRYQWLYPLPYPIETYGKQRAEELEISANRDLAEILVPPVTLFNY